MKKRTAELILKDPEKFAHHDRVFLHNPVVMQGMGLEHRWAVVATTRRRTAWRWRRRWRCCWCPPGVLACLLSRLVPLRDEEPTPEQLQEAAAACTLCTQPAPPWCIWRRIPF